MRPPTPAGHSPEAELAHLQKTMRWEDQEGVEHVDWDTVHAYLKLWYRLYPEDPLPDIPLQCWKNVATDLVPRFSVREDTRIIYPYPMQPEPRPLLLMEVLDLLCAEWGPWDGLRRMQRIRHSVDHIEVLPAFYPNMDFMPIRIEIAQEHQENLLQWAKRWSQLRLGYPWTERYNAPGP